MGRMRAAKARAARAAALYKVVSKGALRCAYCEDDISGLFVRCASCSDHTNLCIQCFRLGVEVGAHRPFHRYRLKDAGAFVPLDGDDANGWTFIELCRLLNSVETHGIGNWKDVATSVRTRSSKACEKSYRSLFVKGIIGRQCWEMARRRWKHKHRLMNWTYRMKAAKRRISRSRNLGLSREDQYILTYDSRREEFDCEAHNEADSCLDEASLVCDEEKFLLALKMFQVDYYTRFATSRARQQRVAKAHCLPHAFMNGSELDYIKMSEADSFIAKLAPMTPALRELMKSEQKEFTERFQPFVQFINSTPYELIWKNLLMEKELRERLRELLFARYFGLKKRDEFEEFYRLSYQAWKEPEPLASEGDSEKEPLPGPSDEEDDDVVEIPIESSVPTKVSIGTKPGTSGSYYYPSLAVPQPLEKSLRGGANVSEISERSASGESEDEEEEIILPGTTFLSEAECELCCELEMKPYDYMTYKTVLMKDILMVAKGYKVRSEVPIGLNKEDARKVINFLSQQCWPQTRSS